jgi:DNA-binding XRE family transcriptional regulator
MAESTDSAFFVFKTIFGRKINMDLVTARAVKKKTQWDLRKATGIHQSKISLIEHGYVVPTDKEKELIADVLGCRVDEINWLAAVEKQQGV